VKASRLFGIGLWLVIIHDGRAERGMRYSKKGTLFVAAYVTGLLTLACIGYFYADYRIQAARHQRMEDQRFRSDVTYIDLPRVNLTLGSSTGRGTGRVRMDISLAVEKKYAGRIEDVEPRIADRIVSYLRTVDFDELSRPKATVWLHKRLLQEAVSASDPLPIMDVVLQQFVIL
jgi:flagellar basal body-associated protein FliL